MHCKHQLIVVVLLLVMLVNLAGCARANSDYAASNRSSSSTPTAAPSPTPKEITPADLAKLKWIEGTWRGTGGNVPPFYERYKFENESTLAVETLADETLTKVSEVSRFELKDGHFVHSEGDSGSVATALDDHSISFAPFGKPSNYFRFQRESDNTWKAILNWTDKNGAAKERIYTMERWPAKKQ
ncbi:MAG TPA: hypothetical protein VGJ66_09485 [Pyrinomonadaceae bacterium]|jgi:hypothetical protein